MKLKSFRCPVHGYISIPSDYCSEFTDTLIFQRLRRIEQTSMKPLYPSANHDRFSHSLGVYHLGKKAIGSIQRNSDQHTKTLIKRFRTTFLIACLLHDCGHAPFSHIYEKYYKKDDVRDKLRDIVEEEEEFKEDIKHCRPAPHEMASALVLLTYYKRQIVKLKGEPELAARMIIGCPYRGAKTKRKKIANCLIELLNGKAIDVDKLDYIIRDTWSSGVNNVSIDVERLLNSLLIMDINGRKEFKLVFDKSALSVIKSIILGRNYLYEWIYSHHTVMYYGELLKIILEKVAKKIYPNESERFFTELFSLKTFDGQIIDIGPHKISLPTDDDFLYLMKYYKNDIPEISELLSRQPTRFPLWKTYAEFRQCLSDKSQGDIDVIKARAKDVLDEKLKTTDTLIIDVSPKIAQVKENEIFININGEVKSISDIFEEDQMKVFNHFYAFINIKKRKSKNTCIRALISSS